MSAPLLALLVSLAVPANGPGPATPAADAPTTVDTTTTTTTTTTAPTAVASSSSIAPHVIAGVVAGGLALVGVGGAIMALPNPIVDVGDARFLLFMAPGLLPAIGSVIAIGLGPDGFSWWLGLGAAGIGLASELTFIAVGVVTLAASIGFSSGELRAVLVGATVAAPVIVAGVGTGLLGAALGPSTAMSVVE